MTDLPENITEEQVQAVLKTVASVGQSITREQAIEFIQNTYAELEMEKKSNFKERIKNLQNRKS